MARVAVAMDPEAGQRGGCSNPKRGWGGKWVCLCLGVAVSLLVSRGNQKDNQCHFAGCPKKRHPRWVLAPLSVIPNFWFSAV